MKKPRILLADDHPDMLAVLCDVFEDGLGEVVGMVKDGYALVEAAQGLKPGGITPDF